MPILRSDLSRLAAQMPEAMHEALLQTGADIASLASQLAPVDTGNLRDSIGAVPVSSTQVEIGTAELYGKFQEYGTSQMAAQPFLTPAFVEVEATFVARMKEAAERVLVSK